MSRTPKLQRWVDLLAALLGRRFAVPFDQLAREVPAYGDPAQQGAARMRMFERDKDELRAFGVPIESILLEDRETHGYRLAATDFYLPYLAFASDVGVEAPAKVGKFGYHALRTLTFEPDELAALSDAAARLRTLGDPALTADVDAAVRKLAFDLPLDVGIPSDGTHVARTRDRVDPAVFEALGDALMRRKQVSFSYHSMSSDTTATRTVQPYGLFFLDSHWYLAGRDIERDALRNFRLGRITGPSVNATKPQTPDYTVPADFDLRAHARARHPWELGDESRVDVIVEFTRETGAALAAMALGAPVPGHDRRRTFAVNRTDAFCRWVLSFAGDANIVGPAEVRTSFDRLVAQTQSLYAKAGA